MTLTRSHVVCALAIFIATAGGRAWSQETGKTKDDALESLLKELNEPEKGATKSDKGARTDGDKAGAAREKSTAGSPAGKAVKAPAKDEKKPPAPKSRDTDKIAPKDQALDELLGKLGEARDEPAALDQPQGRGPGEDRRPQPPGGGGGKPAADKLGGKDKDLDERLEELTGRKKKRSSSDQERTGPIGDMIKEMREVEQRLGKPDPSEATQKKQKQIVKRIETLIEQAKQSGSSMGRLTMRRVRQAGQQPGQQPGDEPGAQARGAPPMKPAKPTSQHSTADGKEAWGHLPPELRSVMENTFKETALDSKSDLISRYFLSVAKGKPVRGE